jgi:acyl-CoA synthetase (AMP-forming)/AMP-acid ligase II
MQEAITVLDPVTMEPVPWDGETMGEIMFRGNLVMKGYLKNPKATQESFAGGWYHTGDLAVMHPDGYVKIKDRSKDVIISGGENISSIEVEDVLYRHPAVLPRRSSPSPTRSGARFPAPSSRCAKAQHRASRTTSTSAAAHGALQGAQAGHLLHAAEDLDRQDPEVRPARAGQVFCRDRVSRIGRSRSYSPGSDQTFAAL